MIVELELTGNEYHLMVGLEEEKEMMLKAKAKKTPEKKLLSRFLRRWQRGMRRIRPPLSSMISSTLTMLSHQHGALG